MINEYEDTTHTYRIDNEIVPSVTEIAKPISIEKYMNIPRQIINYKADLGSRVHEYIEEYLLSEGDFDFEEVDSDCLPYLFAFNEWYHTYKPKVLYTELEMYYKGDDGKSFAGRTDLVCVIDDKIYNIDYKTTATIDKKSLSVQMYGYDYLLRLGRAKNGNLINCKIQKSYVLQLKKDQLYIFKEIERDGDWFDLLLKHAWKMREKK